MKQRSYSRTHKAQVAARIKRPTSTHETHTNRALDLDLVKLDGHPIEDRGFVRVSPNWNEAFTVMASERTQLPGRKNRWEQATERHDPSAPKRVMVSSDIRPPVVRSFTGGKASTPSTQGADMKLRIESQYAMMHHTARKAKV